MSVEWRGSLNLYNHIAKPLRDDDAKALLLKRFMEGGQQQHQLVESEIISLFDQISPQRARAGLLAYFKDIVGLGPDLDDIISSLTSAQLRNMIIMAPSLCKQLGTVPGLMAVLRTLLGRPATYLDWFKYRFLCDETCLELDNSDDASMPCVVGGVYDEPVKGDCTYLATRIHPIDRFDSKWSLLKVMDDGALDHDLLLKLVSLHRALGERIEVQLLEFIDEMSLPGTTTELWDISGAAGDISIEDKVMTIPPGKTLVPRIVCADPSDMSELAMSVDFKFAGDNAALTFAWYIPESDYEGAACVVVSPTPTRLMVQKNGGTWTTEAQDNVLRIGLQSGVWYNLKIESFIIDATRTGIRVYLDGNMVLPTSGDRLSVTGLNQQGTTALSVSGTNNTQIRMAEIHRLPLRYALVNLSNGANKRGVMEKSDNF